MFSQIFKRIGLPFHEAMLTWNSRPDVDIDNLDGDHHHLYQEVLSSKGMHPDEEAIPVLESFPEEQGFREHVSQCLQIYQRLMASPARIIPPTKQPKPYTQDRSYQGN
jgi:hypothetical protein